MPSIASCATAGGRAVRANRGGADASASRATGSRWSAPAGPRPTITTRPGTGPLSARRRRGAGRGASGDRAHERAGTDPPSVLRIDADVELAHLAVQQLRGI